MDQNNLTNQNPSPIDINNLGMDAIRESSTQTAQPERKVYDLNDIANADDSAYENVQDGAEPAIVPPTTPVAPAVPAETQPEMSREHLSALFATDLVEKSPNIATAPVEVSAPAEPATPAPTDGGHPTTAPALQAQEPTAPAPVDEAPLQIITAPPAKQTNRGLIIAIVAILLLAAAGVGAYFAFFSK